MSLKQYIAQQNVFETFFNKAYVPMDIKTLTQEQKASLAKSLASHLSPEALTCDGELRGAKLQAKARMLRKAKAELEAMGVTVEEY